MVRCYAIMSVIAKYYSYFVCVETFKIYHGFGRMENIFLVSCLCFNMLLVMLKDHNIHAVVTLHVI